MKGAYGCDGFVLYPSSQPPLTLTRVPGVLPMNCHDNTVRVPMQNCGDLPQLRKFYRNYVDSPAHVSAKSSDKAESCLDFPVKDYLLDNDFEAGHENSIFPSGLSQSTKEPSAIFTIRDTFSE